MLYSRERIWQLYLSLNINYNFELYCICNDKSLNFGSTSDDKGLYRHV